MKKIYAVNDTDSYDYYYWAFVFLRLFIHKIALYCGTTFSNSVINYRIQKPILYCIISIEVDMNRAFFLTVLTVIGSFSYSIEKLPY